MSAASRDRSQSDIWLADVIQAWKDTAARTPEERRRVAAVLGFTYRVPDPAPLPPPLERPVRTERPADARHVSQFRPDVLPAHPLERPNTGSEREEAETAALPLAIEPPAAEGLVPPAWAVVTDLVPIDEPRHLRHQPPLEPLFTPGWTRAALSAFAATQVAEGAIDFGQVLDALCRRRPLAMLPREPVWTLRRGVQVLVDENEGISFYQRDVAAIVGMVAAVAGRDRTQVLRFVNLPTRGVRRSRFDPAEAWRPPAPGTPVIVVSDFGLVRGARKRGGVIPGDWEQVATLARAAGCALLGIVPLEPVRWPPRLRRALRLLRWDRRATAALARRVARGELA